MKGTAEGGRVIIFIPDFGGEMSCVNHVIMFWWTGMFKWSCVLWLVNLKFFCHLIDMFNKSCKLMTSRYLYTCKLPYCNEVIRYFDLIDRFNKLWNLTSHNNLFISKLCYFDGQVFWVVWQVQQVIDLIFRYSKMLIILLTGTDHVELGQSRSISYLDWRVQFCINMSNDCV